MSNRRSLADGSGFDSIGRGSSRGSGGGSSGTDKIKIGVAVGLLIVAALLLAWNFGLFPDRAASEYTPPTQEQIVEYERRVQENQRLVEEGRIAAPAGE